MSRLPAASGQEAVRVFERIGYRVVRRRGSHIRLRDETHSNHLPLTVPDHKTLKPGLLRRLIRDAGLSVEQFTELLGQK
jgi:predicted RNA binding protein YcfA (HicA-like mRNA interferase family)